MISLRNFSMRRGERLLLSNVDLTMHAGYRVGVVGRNGTGKSSLFAAVKGELEADKGDVDLPGKVRTASVSQETPSLPDPALSFVLGGDIEVSAVLQEEAAATAREDWEAVANAHQKMAEIGAYDAEARAGKLLHGLGFPADTHHRAVSSFSGGWRVRLNLARALMMPSDLLLLDEPTNHLDMDAVLWLEQWLLKYPGTLLLISHDREFLDNVATHTLHLHGGTAKLYVGGYTDFERQRIEHLRQQQIAHDKEQAERARLALALIAWQQPNVLLLDEPTNHLDLEMREALAEALSDFEGAIVMVSHDRHLIGLVCDSFWRVADGVVEPFAGDLDEYAAWLRSRPAAQGTKQKMAEVAPTPPPPTKPLPPKKAVNPHKLASAEKRVGELEAALAALDRELANPGNYADSEKMAVLGRDREATAQQLAEAETAWMELIDGA
ncbi:ABC-F family ATP-binding cassette domain-containing protein [Xanthomonas citri pv. citri]